MKAPVLAALMSLAALGACNSEGTPREPGSAKSASSNASRNSVAPAAPGSDVETQVADAARRLQPQLPMQLPGGAAITAVEARGTQLVTSLTLPVDLTEAAARAIAQPMTAQQCADPRLADMVSRGGRMTWRITDSGGEKFDVTGSEC